ncbi:hypothetical protein MTR67_026977, partial [Solanum verrucosum]
PLLYPYSGVCSYKDVTVDAATGSGKTLAFVLPLVEILRRYSSNPKPHKGVITLYNSPAEIVNCWSTIVVLQCCGVCSKLLYEYYILIRHSATTISFVQILILDEADRLLGMGFEKQINSIISHLPKLRRTEIKQLSGFAPGNSTSSKTSSGLHIEYIECEADKKSSQLVHLLRRTRDYFGVRYLIFLYFCSYVMTCACVDCWGTVLPCLSCLKSFSLISLHRKIKQTVSKKDRDVMEKGLGAFVSYICAYKEHQCSYILRWKELQIGKLGMGYGLLQLPSVPDVKHHSLFTKVFTAVEDINLEEIKYTLSLLIIQPADNHVEPLLFPLRNKFREKQRKKNLQMKKAAIAQQEEQKTLRLKKEANSTATDMRKKTAKQRRATKLVEDEDEDEDEITREYPLLKKLKREVIGENEFAKLTGIEDLLSDT